MVKIALFIVVGLGAAVASAASTVPIAPRPPEADRLEARAIFKDLVETNGDIILRKLGGRAVSYAPAAEWAVPPIYSDGPCLL